MGLFERAPGSVTGGTVRKTMAWIGGRGWVDPVPGADEMRHSGGVMPTIITTTTTSMNCEDPSGVTDEGCVAVGDSEGSVSGEDVGEGVRVLHEDLVRSSSAV